MRLPLHWSLIAVALCLLRPLPAAAEDDDGPCPITIDNWDVVRARKDVRRGSNLMDVTFTATNQGDEDLRNVTFTMTLYEAMGKPLKRVPRSRPVRIPEGKTATVRLADNWVPKFGSYTMDIRAHTRKGAKEWRLLGPNEHTAPSIEDGKLMPGQARVVVLGHTYDNDARRGIVEVKARVRNQGEKTAEDVRLLVTFIGDNNEELGTVEQVLRNPNKGNRPVLEGGEEVVTSMRVRGVRSFSGFRIKPKNKAVTSEESLSGGEFTDAEEIEVARYTFSREDKTLVVEAQVRNGLPQDILDLELTYDLQKDGKTVRRVPVRVPGMLREGKVRPISFRVEDCPAFESYEVGVSYGEPDGAGVTETTSSTGIPLLDGRAPGQLGMQVTRGEMEDGTLTLKGRVVNQTPHPVVNVTVFFDLTLGDGSVREGALKAKIAGPVPPGGEAPFKATLKEAPDFSSYAYRIAYSARKKVKR